MLPSQVDRLPLGEWAYNAQIIAAAREEWREAVDKRIPNVPGARMGFELADRILEMILKETG